MSILEDIAIISDFEEYLSDKKHMAGSSVRIYIRCIKQFLSTNPKLDVIDDYNKFLINHSIKKRSRHYHSILKTFIGFYTDDNLLKNQLLRELIRPPEVPNIKRERIYISEKDILDLIRRFDHDKHKIIATIMTTTGVRVGDVLKIRRGNIIPETYKGKNALRIVIEGKRGKRNVVYIHDKIIQEMIVNFIVRNFVDQEYYFLWPSTRETKAKRSLESKMHTNYIRFFNDLKAAMDSKGIDYASFSTHDFRRCFARRVWTRWKDLQVLQDLLNHADPKTTMLYLKGSGLKNVDYHKELQS